ncbi:hypothetical protein dsx2_1318 [Desulfovibrio sp. X2]|uniref:carboxypeptidase-like regulatory domain-containing protein n=1 Tax=Desulfovibrio sp. X2 TaxID=941449 RepID=UPI000358C949|nr:carboxypeptidase-like regulatory domain-containing protein [Desulfovibrio sp. X2]EPR44690.1 hypothetical protein dsx2_1318 [Desulfovibrio sp. X2]
MRQSPVRVRIPAPFSGLVLLLAAACLCALLSPLLSPSPALAQQSASVSGQITLPSGDSVIGAIVELSLNGTTVDTDVTGFDGGYAFSGLKPASGYEIMVTMETHSLRSHVFDLAAGQKLNLDLSF